MVPIICGTSMAIINLVLNTGLVTHSCIDGFSRAIVCLFVLWLTEYVLQSSIEQIVTQATCLNSFLYRSFDSVGNLSISKTVRLAEIWVDT